MTTAKPSPACNLELVRFAPRPGENGRLTVKLLGWVEALRMDVPFFTKAEAVEYAADRGWTFRDRT